MRRGVDTNVLIYAHMPESPHHAAVRSLFAAYRKESPAWSRRIDFGFRVVLFPAKP